MNKKKIQKSALYVRVSTTHQIDKDSLPLQKQDLINYSKYVLNINDYEIFEDAGYSGGNTKRPAYQDMIKRMKNGEFSHLLVWKIDRISRNLKDFSEMYDKLKEYNITFISKNEQFDTSSAMGEAMLKIILVFAELERKLTSERVFSVMMSRAEKGLWNGATVPFGYDFDKKTKYPIPNEEEAKIVEYIYKSYKEIKSTTKVAHKLNIEKIKTKRKGSWTARTVGGILSNPFYIGTYRYNLKDKKSRYKDKSEWIIIDHNHTPIIDESLFEEVNAILKVNYKGDNSIQRKMQFTHILKGILTCNECGSHLNAGRDRVRADGFSPSRYTCYKLHNETKCNNYASDLSILPFIINYIGNYITLQNKITSKHTYRDMESILLRGKYFKDISHIMKKDLVDTYNLLINNKPVFYNAIEQVNNNRTIEKNNKLNEEKKKYENALEKLDDLFLFDQNAMSQKDYILKRKKIISNIETIESKIINISFEETPYINNNDFSLNAKASFYLLTKNINNVKNIDVRNLLNIIEKETLQIFIQTIIHEIHVHNSKIYSITFKNGITHHFEY